MIKFIFEYGDKQYEKLDDIKDNGIHSFMNSTAISLRDIAMEVNCEIHKGEEKIKILISAGNGTTNWKILERCCGKYSSEFLLIIEKENKPLYLQYLK